MRFQKYKQKVNCLYERFVFMIFDELNGFF